MGKIARNLFRKFWLHLPFGCFVIAILCLCFTYGVMVGKWHVFPYRFLDACLDSLRELRYERSHDIHPARYEGQGVVVYEPEQLFAGITLIAGYLKNGDDWNLGIRLIDLNGETLHQWLINPHDIWDRSPHHDYASRSRDVWMENPCIHGVLLLPGGDIIFNLDYVGLVRLNASSEIVWKLPYRTHHSVFLDDEGKIWVCGAKWYEDYVSEFPGVKPPFMDDIILKLSLEGVIERAISVLQTIYKSGYYSLIITSRQKTGDILHLNDIELLSKRKEDRFTLFKAGDIMVSVRHINAVFVIDGQTEQIKWIMTYPFIDQHDPDFTNDGYITVFDNNLEVFGGSRILRIEPVTREIKVLYGHKSDQYFFTFRCGKHQHLPNGNILITEAQAGRIFEVDANGKVVWSWITPRWDENNVPEILEGIRYSAEYAGFTSSLGKDQK
jgi:hypothetical protein